MIYISSFIKSGSAIEKLVQGGSTDSMEITESYISVSLSFPQNKESRLKIRG
jgi:hypothetical protein